MMFCKLMLNILLITEQNLGLIGMVISLCSQTRTYHKQPKCCRE